VPPQIYIIQTKPKEARCIIYEDVKYCEVRENPPDPATVGIMMLLAVVIALWVLGGIAKSIDEGWNGKQMAAYFFLPPAAILATLIIMFG
jgi:hypothetical protein